ncbi:eCIS core domain-containing protein [Kibdelosporangium phytohabitans]|uniref:Uncharacterized protein n=1 Tax=Kibdelosporangium phytohabitans TaxID=860235 RepID=A0A0N9HXW6_9PSEU|nr:DUF4157 domain-containing protein [Kibdelosporangium phytohabitans]ALG08406.1 hypothetical protein AOZ06_17135 [Kibdelosporangium phytohabitans]MBE1470545.1 hypothetical protein [Kibdelosporangium phytohabitans]
MQSRQDVAETEGHASQPAQSAGPATGSALGNAAMTRAFGAGSNTPAALGLAAGASNAATARLLGGAPVSRCGPVPCDCEEPVPPELLAAALHRSATNEHTPSTPSPEFLTAVGRSGAGRPLPPGFRAEAEARFDADFTGVRVHTDNAAGQAAELVDAHAFTVGPDIYFEPGGYQPDDAGGQRLLAHELTHVVQGGGPRASGWVSHPADPAEREAESVADRFMAGGPVSVGAAGARQVRREGPAVDTSTLEQALRNDDVPGVVAQLTGHSPQELTAMRTKAQTVVSTKLEVWLLHKVRGSEAARAVGTAMSWAGAAIPGVGTAAAAAGRLLGGGGNAAAEAERGIRLLWPALSLLEKLQLYDEGWRELEQAQLDVIRAASDEQRSQVRANPALGPIYAAMDPKEEFQARLLINPTAEGKYEAMQQLLNRAPGTFHDEEDAVFDGIMELTPAQRGRFHDANRTAIESLFSEDRSTLFRNLCKGTEAQALIARLREATEGRSDDMDAVKSVVDRAVALLQERAGLRASLTGGNLPDPARVTAEARLAELNDLDQLLRFTRGGDGQLDSAGFMGVLAAARGDGAAFGADTARLGQFTSGPEARQHAFETAKQRILMSGGDVNAIKSAIMGLHAPRATPAAGAPAAAGVPSAAQQQEDQRIREELLRDPAVAGVINGLTAMQRALVTGATTADAYDETAENLNQAHESAEWGRFFQLVLRIARDPDWCTRFRASAGDPFGTYARVHGEQRTIMEAILANPRRIPLDALLAFSGDAEVLATAVADMGEEQRGRLRQGYILANQPPIGPPTEAQTTTLAEYRQFETLLRTRGAWYRIPLDGEEYQRVLWAVLGKEPTAEEMATGEGRFRAAELMYQQARARLGLDPGVSASFTETDETMQAAAREFAAQFEPMRPRRTVTSVDFAALAALHDRFTGRAAEFGEAASKVGEMAGVVAATVAGIAVVAATGGTATPAVIALAAASGAGARVVTREMMGGDYFNPASEEGVRNAVLGAVDGALAVVGSALAARGAELIGVGGRALVTSAARVGGAVAEEATAAAAQVAPSMARRIAASSVEAALDGAFSGAVSEAFGAMTDPATWRRGVWSGLVRVGEAALVAGLVGLGTGGLLGAALPVLGAGASRLWNAAMSQGIDQVLAKAGATETLAAARRAAQAGDVAEVNRLLDQLETHLSADQASALRHHLNSELTGRLGSEVGEGVLAARPADGHTIKVTESGRIIRCSRCDDILDLLDEYRAVFADNPGYVERLGRIEDLADAARKARKAKNPNASQLADQAADDAAALLRDVRTSAQARGNLAREGQPLSGAGRLPAEVVQPISPARIQEGLNSLAAQRVQRGLPPAGSATDVSTVCRLDIGGESFYGVNAHHTTMDLHVNAQTATHAEGQAFQLGARSLPASRETRAVLYVDRELCRACGDFGGVESMAKQLGLLQLDVYTPNGLALTLDFAGR